MRDDDPGGEQRPDRASGVPADLENRLCEAVPPAGCEPRDSRGFRMKDRRARADERRGEQYGEVIWRDRERQQSEQSQPHAVAQRIRLRVLIGVNADERLQHRRADLVGQRYQADLGEIQIEFALQQRVDRNDQRLDQVVEEMRKTDRAQKLEARGLDDGGGGGRICGEAFVHTARTRDAHRQRARSGRENRIPY